jgi:hypothetical protein
MGGAAATAVKAAVVTTGAVVGKKVGDAFLWKLNHSDKALQLGSICDFI